MATQYTAGLAQGQVLTAAIMNQIGAAWESYTPTLTATTTNPTLGTGSTRTGAYTQIQKKVFFYAEIGFGTAGTAAGTGTYLISLPITGRLAYGIIGSSWIYDASANRIETGVVRMNNTTTVYLYQTATTTYQTQAGQPWAWGASDALFICGTYEAA